MNSILKFYSSLKIPTKITIYGVIIVTSTCLFAPVYFLEILGISIFVEKFRGLIGVVFLISLSIALVYLIVYCFYKIKSLITKITFNYEVNKSIEFLTKEDCEYVLSCFNNNKYFKFTNLAGSIEFDEKWNGILSIPTGNSVQMYVPYKILANKTKIKRIKRRLECFENQ